MGVSVEAGPVINESLDPSNGDKGSARDASQNDPAFECCEANEVATADSEMSIVKSFSIGETISDGESSSKTVLDGGECGNCVGINSGEGVRGVRGEHDEADLESWATACMSSSTTTNAGVIDLGTAVDCWESGFVDERSGGDIDGCDAASSLVSNGKLWGV